MIKNKILSIEKKIKVYNEENKGQVHDFYHTLYTLRTTHLLRAYVASARAGRIRMLGTLVLPKLIDFVSVGRHDVTTRSGHATKPHYRSQMSAKHICGLLSEAKGENPVYLVLV